MTPTFHPRNKGREERGTGERMIAGQETRLQYCTWLQEIQGEEDLWDAKGSLFHHLCFATEILMKSSGVT